MKIQAWALGAGLLGLVACGPDIEPQAIVDGSASDLDSICVDDVAEIPEGELTCGDERSYECGVEEPGDLYVTAADLGQATCGTSTLTVSDPGPYAVGTHAVDVLEITSTGTVTVCTSTITIVDSSGPDVTGNVLELWPPNHDMVAIAPADCADFEDACSDELDFEYTYVIVDEDENGRGDGNFEPDVELGCDGDLRLRAERAGPGDGRVYRVGFRVDDGNGNRTAGECVVEVPHDRSRDAVESHEVYRIELEEDECVEDEEPECVCEDDDEDDDDKGGRGSGRGRDKDHGDDDDEGRGNGRGKGKDKGKDKHRGTVNTGPLPEGCTKIEGSHIGTSSVTVDFGHNSVLILEWMAKYDSPGDYIGFDYVLTSTPAFVSVKAGGDVFTDYLTDTATNTWQHPGGDRGPKAKGISNVVFCDENPFVHDDDDKHPGDDDDDDDKHPGDGDDDDDGHPGDDDDDCICEDDGDDGEGDPGNGGGDDDDDDDGSGDL